MLKIQFRSNYQYLNKICTKAYYSDSLWSRRVSLRNLIEVKIKPYSKKYTATFWNALSKTTIEENSLVVVTIFTPRTTAALETNRTPRSRTVAYNIEAGRNVFNAYHPFIVDFRTTACPCSTATSVYGSRCDSFRGQKQQTNSTRNNWTFCSDSILFFPRFLVSRFLFYLYLSPTSEQFVWCLSRAFVGIVDSFTQPWLCVRQLFSTYDFLYIFLFSNI